MLKLFLLTPSITGGFVLPIRRTTKKELDLHTVKFSVPKILQRHIQPCESVRSFLSSTTLIASVSLPEQYPYPAACW